MESTTLNVKRAFLTRHELRLFSVRTARFFLDVAVTWGVIFTIFLCLFLLSHENRAISPMLVAIVTFLMISLLQYHLLHAAHEASHQDFWPKSKTATLVALCVAYPIGLSRSFRDEHLLHHKYLGDSKRDPDFCTYGTPPKSRTEFVIFVFGSLSGLATIKQILWRIRSMTPTAPAKYDLLMLTVVQMFLLGIITLSMHPIAYFIFWLLPLLTVVKGLAQLRGLAEHGDPVAGRYVLRTFLSGGVVARFMGNMGFCHHAEHHLYPMVPYENLQMVREGMLSKLNIVPAIHTSVEINRGSHFSFLWDWFRRLQWREANGGLRSSE